MARKKDLEAVAEPAGEGHNITGKFSKDRLNTFIKRIEKMEEEKREISTDIRGTYQEAEAAGLDAKAMRRIVSDRRKEKDIVTQHYETVRHYKEALGDFSSTPLGMAGGKGKKKSSDEDDE